MFFVTVSCKQNTAQNQGSENLYMVEAYQVMPEIYSESIRATGELLSFEETEIMAPVPGNVLNIYFREGQNVNKGDLLVEIDNRSWSARKRGLEAQLISAESDLVRKKDLLQIEGVSQEELEQSQATVSNLKAQIDELDVMIDLAHIQAPYSGRLGMRNFSPGAYLRQGDIITSLVQSHKLRVNFSIPARYASLAKENQEVEVISSASGDTAVAVIYAIDPTINPASRSLQIRAMLDNEQGRFVAGDFAQIIFDVEQTKDALLVPAESIIPELNTQVVFIARNGRAVRQEVETGSRTRDRVQILNGLSPGDYVLTTGLMEIRDGDQINFNESIVEEPL
ncbi:MAG: efflux RND transporter periplasmic adaptor subunit [Bacteroidales bacterium]